MQRTPPSKMLLFVFLFPSLFAVTYAVTIPSNSTSRSTSSNPTVLSSAPALSSISSLAVFTFTTLKSTLYPCSLVINDLVEIYCNGREVAAPEGEALPPYLLPTAPGLSPLYAPEATGSPTFGTLGVATPGSVVVRILIHKALQNTDH